MAGSEEEPTLDVARGDRALSEHLKNSLRLLRGKTDDTEFRTMVDDILAGRSSLREAVSAPAFDRVLSPFVSQAAEKFENLSEQEWQQLEETGERQFAEFREELSQRERQARAAETEDPEEEDFSQRSWLE
ncbi:hypothetical protein [Actinopolyspora mortivallis]|uniref:Uncharacterized protein n=1 Tax=Actinopolyspora mortivallis TaxID=33906 RepID=A0A2T0GTS2_ACTMO|nr:hypothetical protein [Actinopolyspora mortivallis]PRW62497.1 hypothetical protein CEP50_15275 [Actinopolyspora mortivallis]